MSLIKPLVFGGIDGLTTTLALVWGSIAAGEQVVSSTAVIVLGVANLLATGMSMGVGDYAGTLAEYDQATRVTDAAKERALPGEIGIGRRSVQQAALRSGFTMFASFIIFGGIPLLAYLPASATGAADIATRRVVSTLLCVVSFLGLGAVRGRLTDTSVVRASLQMLLMGTGAATVSFLSSKLIYWALIGSDAPALPG